SRTESADPPEGDPAAARPRSRPSGPSRKKAPSADMSTSTPTPTGELPALGAQGTADRDRSPAPAGAAPLIAVLVVSAFVMILNETLDRKSTRLNSSHV